MYKIADARRLEDCRGSGDSLIDTKGNEFRRIWRTYDSTFGKIMGVFWSIMGGLAVYPYCLVWHWTGTELLSSDIKTKAGTAVLRIVYAVIALVVLSLISQIVKAIVQKQSLFSLRKLIFQSLMKLDIAYFDRTPTELLISRLTEDVTLVNDICFRKVLDVIEYCSKLTGAFVTAMVFGWRVTLSVIVVVPISGLVFFWGDRKVDKYWKDFFQKQSEMETRTEEVISSFRIVKSFDQEEEEASRFTNSTSGILDVYKKCSIIDGIRYGIVHFFGYGIQPPVIYFTCWSVIRRPEWGMNLGDISVMLLIMIQMNGATTNLMTCFDDIKKARFSAAKILSLIEAKPKVDQTVGITLKETNGKIEFRDITFQYEGRKEHALRHLSFVVNSGETVAFVGESGCGKSTVLQLLQRFYEPQKGQILIDNIDIQTLSGVSVREQISFVSQSPNLYSMSVAENIKFATDEANESEVAAAARMGNAHNFIMELPENYETLIKQSSLSGGQKQRICISRAVLRNSPILLLDEATASLDTESEQLVQQSIDEYRTGKTAVIVAHRLSTVKNADRIFVFKKGKIRETGTFKELMEKSGYFAKLVKYQLQ